MRCENGMPALCFLSASEADLARRSNGLKASLRSTFFTVGRWPPKKLEMAGLRGSGLDAAESGLGLEVALVLPPGWKVFAAGLGLNSWARTLNRREALDAGVCAPLDDCEGPDGARMSCEGIGWGTPLKEAPPCLSCCWFSVKRVLSRPWLRAGFWAGAW